MAIQKDLLVFTTAGNIDDGKSTLTGRLIFDCRGFCSDQIAAVTKEDMVNFAHFTDGLKKEQTEGITIDVGHRYFESSRRRFILRDAPGHFQFTRNLVTAASTAQVMVLVVDASRPVAPQTVRHLTIALLLHLKVIVCVNKMDLVQWKQDTFEKVRRELLGRIPNSSAKMTFVPTAALPGDGIAKKSKNMPWYRGPTLLEALESGRPKLLETKPTLLPVQIVNSDGSVSGEVTQGKIGIGEEVRILPSGQKTKILRVLVHGRDKERVGTGTPVRVYFGDGVECKRGDVIALASGPEPKKEIEASIFWLHPERSIHNRDYVMRCWTRNLTARISAHSVLDFDNDRQEKKNFFEVNDVGVASVTPSEALPFDSYQESVEMGSMIFIDPDTNEVVAAGIVRNSTGDR